MSTELQAVNLFGEIEPADENQRPLDAAPAGAAGALRAGTPGSADARRDEPPPGPFASVALEQSIDRTLSYAVPPRLAHALKVGQRVRVPLGRRNRPARGYVIAIDPTTDFARAGQVKRVLEIEDDRVLVPPALMELARWMSRYYVTPLGTVLESVIPSAVKKKVGLGYNRIVRLAQPREQVQGILEKTSAPKRRAILARLLQLGPGESIELVRLAGESGATLPTVRKLARLGLISVTAEVDLPRLTAGMGPIAGDAVEADILLNADQRKAFDDLRPRLTPSGPAVPGADPHAPGPSPTLGGKPGFSVNLLMGVTGSGKTEVYLQCIREVLNSGRGAIVLVPEIALTPQTVRRFMARFQSVAILHSGLTATDRHRYWQLISTGQARVVVGARSAVFAPLPNLGIIVVDEEHEASYKQDTAPRYNGRDVAIKRAQLESIPVILGSATPSLETYWKATGANADLGNIQVAMPAAESNGTGSALSNSMFSIAQTAGAVALPKYHLLTLPRRVRGLSMPHVELVDMKQENRFRRGVNLLSQRLEHLLRTTVESKHQAILLLNRRGYSNFVYCASCTNVIQCKYCDVTMTYHRSAGEHPGSASNAAAVHTGQLHCHYCLAVNPLPSACPKCGKLVSLFGLGTQRVEEEISRKFPDLKFARVDGDTMRNSRDYEALLGRFAGGEIQVMLGTQMIAKGLDYPNVTLVGVISGDTALALPDFRAAERTFQLITQVAGRAGRGDSPGRVVLQTFLPDDPTIQAAIRQDYAGFARGELVSRRDVGLPPFARMVRIVLRDQEQPKLSKISEELAARLADAALAEGCAVKTKGPMPCAISRISGYYRNQIVMTSPTAAPLQRILAAVREKGGLAKSDKIAVDVDPVSLL
jgi:primosomal protein N' (replication factor Y)